MTRDFSRGGTISLGAIKRVTTARSCERASTDRVPGTNPRADAMPRINDKQARNSRGIRSNYTPRTCSYRSRVLSDARETSQSCSRSGDRNLLVETPEGFGRDASFETAITRNNYKKYYIETAIIRKN